jgi:hypothetical protein
MILAAVPTSLVLPTRRFAEFPMADVSREEGLKMSNRHGRLEPTDVTQACQLIQANWTDAQRRERRLLAAAKRRQLMHHLAAARMLRSDGDLVGGAGMICRIPARR